VDLAAQAGLSLDQEAALRGERLPDFGSSDRAVSDQDLTEVLAGLALRLECLFELFLREHGRATGTPALWPDPS
jgi:hypothetical protein